MQVRFRVRVWSMVSLHLADALLRLTGLPPLAIFLGSATNAIWAMEFSI